MDRLDVACAIAADPEGVVNATDLGLHLGMASNRVRAQLLGLVAAGLVTELPHERVGKRWFAPVESPFWALCVAWRNEAIDSR